MPAAKLSKALRMCCICTRIWYAALLILTIASTGWAQDSIRFQLRYRNFHLQQPPRFGVQHPLAKAAVPFSWQPTTRSLQLQPVPVHWGWGLFCIGEYKLQQAIRIPLYLRLGNLEYVNRMEGKLK